MSDEHRPTPADGPAHQHLDGHLELLRLAPPEPKRELIARTLRVARWQREVRAPLRVAAMIASAVFDGLRALLPGTTQTPR